MSMTTELAQRTPERKRYDWSQSVMRDCDFCNQWSLTVKHEDGARICASCCDAEYTSKLEVANAALVEALEAKDKQIAELTEARDLFNSKMMGFAYRVEELEARTVKLPEVRITIAESKLRNLTYQQLDAFNAGASRAVAKLSQVLAAAGVAVEGE